MLPAGAGSATANGWAAMAATYASDSRSRAMIAS